MNTVKRRGVRIAAASDMIIIALLLAIAAALFFVFRSGSAGKTAVVTLSGEEYTRVDLSGLTDDARFTVNGVDIEVTPDGARVIGSDCPDKTCVRTGLISSPGEAAACVPNRVVLYIDGKAVDVDGMAY